MSELDRSSLPNGEDTDTVQIRQSTVDELLRAWQDVANAVRELSTRIGSQEIAFKLYCDKVDSDIKELKGDGRKALGSVSDLQRVIADEKIAELKAANEKWKAFAWKVATWVLFGVLGWLAHVAIAGLQRKG